MFPERYVCVKLIDQETDSKSDMVNNTDGYLDQEKLC